MALKNLFDMVKADRYTQDGREAIIKAQEEETEDARRTYQIGEISEATGLQKTAQGWKPPKETKFGKVKQNKEGQWGVQTKQGKGSDFLKHKSEKEASRALANYTAGYNTTERSKQDPHSDQARQVKHWDKETDKIRKQNRAEGRAAHAAQFQKPATQEEIGKFYTKFEDVQSAYDAGRQTFPEGGYTIFETPQGYKVVDDPKISQRMEAAGYRKEAEVPEGTKPPKGPGENIGVNEKENKIRQVLNTALTPSGDKVQMTKSKVTGDFHVLLNGKSTGGGFRDPQKAKEEFNAWIAGKKAPSESAKERINKRFDESEARSQKAMEAAEKSAAPRREAVSAGRMMKDLDGNFWSRPEDFKEDITSRGWDVDEMTNEYAVISNEAGSQYEVRFDDHSDEGDLTVRNFKALQIDEDDDDDSLEDSAPTLSEIVDRVYNIGEISEKTGLQKTANGWVKPKKGAAPAKKENPTRTFEFKAGPDGNPVAGSGKEVKTYKTKKEAEAALKKQNAAAGSKPASENKTTIRQGPKTKTLNETPAEHVQKNLDAYKGYQPYDMEELVLKPSGYEKQTSARVPGGGQSITYTKNGAEDITLFFDRHGELENADVAGSRHAEKRKTNRPKAIRWNRNNLNEMRGNEEYINAKAADNYYHQYGLDKIGEWKDRKGWTVKEYQNDDGETYRVKYNGEKYVGSEYDPTGEILSPENKDAASRVLTGDTRIRVRKA